ncbi:MAG: hypothetical protein ACPGUV_11835, partial [Polyangiales bacterium]
ALSQLSYSPINNNIHVPGLPWKRCGQRYDSFVSSCEGTIAIFFCFAGRRAREAGRLSLPCVAAVLSCAATAVAEARRVVPERPLRGVGAAAGATLRSLSDDFRLAVVARAPTLRRVWVAGAPGRAACPCATRSARELGVSLAVALDFVLRPALATAAARFGFLAGAGATAAVGAAAACFAPRVLAAAALPWRAAGVVAARLVRRVAGAAAAGASSGDEAAAR